MKYAAAIAIFNAVCFGGATALWSCIWWQQRKHLKILSGRLDLQHENLMALFKQVGNIRELGQVQREIDEGKLDEIKPSHMQSNKKKPVSGSK